MNSSHSVWYEVYHLRYELKLIILLCLELVHSKGKEKGMEDPKKKEKTQGKNGEVI